MILEQHRGQDLFDEVVRDFKEVKKAVKKKRDLIRKDYKKNNQIEISETCKFKLTTKTGNLWNISTTLNGDVDKPSADNSYFITTNSGPGGSKLFIIYRGNKTTKKTLGLDGGYLVTIPGHVLTRMKGRSENFKNLSNEELVSKIFSKNEEGIYYIFDWTKYAEKSLVPTSIEDYKDIKFRIKKKEVQQKPIVLKTSAGIFLGYVTVDKAELRLSTFINKTFSDEEEEMVKCFLEPVWICYNHDNYSDSYIEKTYKDLMDYMKDKDDREVGRLCI